MSTNLLHKKWSQLKNKKKRKRSCLARCWPKIGLRKLSQIFNSKRRDFESLTDVDRQNQRLRHEIWTARARSGLRPTLWSQYSQNDWWYVAGAAQAFDTNTFGRCCVENRRQNFSIPLRWEKTGLFSGLGEERRTPRANSRPLYHGCT